MKTSQQGISYQEILRIWREADEISLFEHAWLWDHMVPLRGDIRGAVHEAWTLLVALAAQTQRLPRLHGSPRRSSNRCSAR